MTPKRFSKRELAKVNVDVLKEQKLLFLRCQVCGHIWQPRLTRAGQLIEGYWRCPNLSYHDSIVTREEVAYHEAGHAGLGHLLGIHIDHATIVPRDNIFGQVCYSINLAKLPPSQQVMIALAGPIAEDMVTKSPRFETFDDLMRHSESDGRGVLEVVARHRHEVDVPGHYKVARYLLDKHRHAIMNVAQLLLQKDYISGEVVAQVVNQAA